MKQWMRDALAPSTRKWAYGVTGAGLLVGGVYGYLDGQQIAVWMAFAGAVFGLAIANVDQPAARRARED